MIHRTYGEGFGSADVTAFLKDLAASTSDEAYYLHGDLYALSEHMPLGDIALVLDEIPQASLATPDSRRKWEVAGFIDRALTRMWREIPDIQPARALQWLWLWNSYSRGFGRGRSDQVRLAILERKDRLSAIADHFFSTLAADSNRWAQLNRFREVTFLAVTPAQLLLHIRRHMPQEIAGDEKEVFLYQAASA